MTALDDLRREVERIVSYTHIRGQNTDIVCEDEEKKRLREIALAALEVAKSAKEMRHWEPFENSRALVESISALESLARKEGK